ncbi:hypothetical protein V8C42DRAFT_80884 [Trichoderma barbatum]
MEVPALLNRASMAVSCLLSCLLSFCSSSPIDSNPTPSPAGPYLPTTPSIADDSLTYSNQFTQNKLVKTPRCPAPVLFSF